MLYDLPTEIKTNIFEFDKTGQDQFQQTIHQIKMIPVLHCIVFWKNLFGETWYKSHLFSYRYRMQGGFPLPDKEESRNKNWEMFRKTKMM